MVRDKWRFPDGFCYVDNRGGFEDVIQVVENIPEDLMPPSFKKAEDFVRNVMGIQHGQYAPDTYREENLKIICKFGQSQMEATKDFDLHKARLAIEYGLDAGNWKLKKIKHLLDPQFRDEWIEPKIQNPNVSGRVDLVNKLYILASNVYNNGTKDFVDEDIQEKFDEAKILMNQVDWKNKTDEENQSLRKEAWAVRDIGNKMIEDKKERIKKEIHSRSINRWYDKYAWDFDEEERKKLKNPYL